MSLYSITLNLSRRAFGLTEGAHSRTVSAMAISHSDLLFKDQRQPTQVLSAGMAYHGVMLREADVQRPIFRAHRLCKLQIGQTKRG